MTDQEIIVLGDPVEAMEAAKRLIVADAVEVGELGRVAAEKSNKPGSRVAAIYALGFADDEATAGRVLADILNDPNENEECRAHAAEALGHIGGAGIVPLLENVLNRDDSLEVKRWCVYALSEIGGARARNLLKKLSTTNLTGELADELKNALSRK